MMPRRRQVVRSARPVAVVSLLCALLTGCTAETETPARADSAAAPVIGRLAAERAAAASRLAPGDSAAMLAALEQITAAIDADTTTMTRITGTGDVGAGAVGQVTGWRIDTAWARLRVESGDSTFRSADTYWMQRGALLGARLEIVRPDSSRRVEQIWFRGDSLYRWTDADGRHLNPESRSTQYEVRALRERQQRMLSAITRDSTASRPRVP